MSSANCPKDIIDVCTPGSTLACCALTDKFVDSGRNPLTVASTDSPLGKNTGGPFVFVGLERQGRSVGVI